MAIGVCELLPGAVIVGGVSGVLTSKHNLERERIRARSAASGEESEAAQGMMATSTTKSPG